jgi:hypothetical protein
MHHMINNDCLNSINPEPTKTKPTLSAPPLSNKLITRMPSTSGPYKQQNFFPAKMSGSTAVRPTSDTDLNASSLNTRTGCTPS